jgi:uncharacterized protein (TIGR00369 family)
LQRKYFGVHVPFIDHLGIEAVEIAPGEVESRLILEPHLCNPLGNAHGGVLMSILDFTMAMSAKSLAKHHGVGVTIDMSTTFMKGAKDELIVRGKVLKSGRSIQFCEAIVYDRMGDMCTKAMGSFKLVDLPL